MTRFFAYEIMKPSLIGVTMLLVLFACTAQETPATVVAETEWIQDIEVSTSEAIPAALEVRFSTPEDAIAWVEFGVGGAAALTTPPAALGTEHSLAVIGNPPLSEVTMRVVVEVDGERHTSGTFTHQTGQLLPSTPVIEVNINEYEAPENTQLLMSIFGPVSYLVLMDLQGNITWSLAQGSKKDSYGLSLLPREGEVLYNLFELGGTAASIERVDLLGNPLESVETDEAHHFFSEGPDHSLVWLEEDTREVDGVEVVGDVLMQRSDQGEETVLFSHWDNFTLPLMPSGMQYMEWTHSNWIGYDEARDSYLLSNAYTNTIAELDADGEPIRIMGGPGAMDSEYVFGSVDQAFEYPHGPHWMDNGDLLVFTTSDDLSRVVRYSIDEEYKQLNEVWSYGEDYGFEALWLGEVQELPDGNILVSWGSVGILQIISPDGELIWEASSSFQYFFSQIHAMSDPYTPWR